VQSYSTVTNAVIELLGAGKQRRRLLMNYEFCKSLRHTDGAVIILMTKIWTINSADHQM